MHKLPFITDASTKCPHMLEEKVRERGRDMGRMKGRVAKRMTNLGRGVALALDSKPVEQKEGILSSACPPPYHS